VFERAFLCVIGCVLVWLYVQGSVCVGVLAPPAVKQRLSRTAACSAAALLVCVDIYLHRRGMSVLVRVCWVH